MADRTTCLEHPMLRKCVWVKLPEATKEEPQQREAAPVEQVAQQDECRRNEECRRMMLRLQVLTVVKLGMPGF